MATWCSGRRQRPGSQAEVDLARYDHRDSAPIGALGWGVPLNAGQGHRWMHPGPTERTGALRGSLRLTVSSEMSPAANSSDISRELDS